MTCAASHEPQEGGNGGGVDGSYPGPAASAAAAFVAIHAIGLGTEYGGGGGDGGSHGGFLGHHGGGGFHGGGDCVGDVGGGGCEGAGI